MDEDTNGGPTDERARYRISSQDLERGVHIPIEDQVESVSKDQPETWPDWQEQHRLSLQAGGMA